MNEAEKYSRISGEHKEITLSLVIVGVREFKSNIITLYVFFTSHAQWHRCRHKVGKYANLTMIGRLDSVIFLFH